MANGEVRKITPTRVSIEVDNLAYVIDYPLGTSQDDVVADFMAQWRAKHQREMRQVAANKLREKREQATAQDKASALLAGLPEADIDALTAPAPARTFNFDGFEPVENPGDARVLTAKAQAAKDAADVLTAAAVTLAAPPNALEG